MDKDVPYIVYEAVTARFERIAKRLTVALVISLITLFLTNMAWLWFLNQYEFYADETVTVDGKDGNANYNYIRNGGVISNGDDNSSPQKTDAEEESQE